MTPAELGQWESNPLSAVVPAVTIDGSTLFVNYLGYIFALDLKSGKMLWRSAGFHHLEVSVMQDQARVIDPARFAIVASGEHVWRLGRNLKEPNHFAPFQLVSALPAIPATRSLATSCGGSSKEPRALWSGPPWREIRQSPDAGVRMRGPGRPHARRPTSRPGRRADRQSYAATPDHPPHLIPVVRHGEGRPLLRARPAEGQAVEEIGEGEPGAWTDHHYTPRSKVA
jgi:hypothetical protein